MGSRRRRRVRDSTNLDDDENVEEERGDRHNEEDEHLGCPRPDCPERQRSTCRDGTRLAPPRSSIVRPKVALNNISTTPSIHTACSKNIEFLLRIELSFDTVVLSTREASDV